MKFKKFLNRVVQIIGIVSLFVILSFPFLANKFKPLLTIICFASSLIIFLIIILKGNSKNKKMDIVIMILIYYISIGIFTINFFDTLFNWLWFIFGLLIVAIPCSLYFIGFWYQFKHEINSTQKLNFKRNVVKYTLFYYVLDLFYMSFIIDNLICRYIFGVIAILFIFYNSTKAFINNIKPKIFFIVQDVFVGLGITIYLIFIIPNDHLRNILTSIVSAVFGGYITLLGVAWTIKDNSRNRKEDERQSKIPYLYIEYGEYEKTLESIDSITDEAFKMSDDEIVYCNSIDEFVVKNSNNSDCVPYGFILNEKFYKFNNMFFIERNKRFKVQITHLHSLNSKQNEVTLSIIVKDVLDNCYKYDCELRLEHEGYLVYSEKKIPIDTYHVINLRLPLLIDKQSLV